jgi:hypothetical protein
MSDTSSTIVSRSSTPTPQLAIRSSGPPERQWMARAVEHAAMIVQAANYWEDNFSNIIRLFGRRSPSRGATPPMNPIRRPDSPMPLPIPLPNIP